METNACICDMYLQFNKKKGKNDKVYQFVLYPALLTINQFAATNVLQLLY